MEKIIQKIKRIDYQSLNAKQQENYNFQKISAVLADYGFNCLRLTDDWQGADFIACHIDGENFLKIQLKGRLCFARKYLSKNIYIAFYENDRWYIYDHDHCFQKLSQIKNLHNTDSWIIGGAYSYPKMPQDIKLIIEEENLLSYSS